MDNKKILLIDDERDFTVLVKKRIESWGYEFASASTGLSGIKALIKIKPDLVILDLVMPDMDGISVLKRIRKVNKKIPVIMLTSYEDFDMIKRAEDLNIAAFVFKMTLDVNLRSLVSGILK